MNALGSESHDPRTAPQMESIAPGVHAFMQPDGCMLGTVNMDDEVFKALADASRRRLLDSLNARNGQTLRELCAGLDMARQSVSKHLAVLEQAGLVRRHKEGREVLYDVEAMRLDVATRALAAQAQQWDARLATIKLLAEESHRLAGED